jgi:GR25 family glycosyltransferase involved in LPS biosynthesis
MQQNVSLEEMPDLTSDQPFASLDKEPIEKGTVASDPNMKTLHTPQKQDLDDIDDLDFVLQHSGSTGRTNATLNLGTLHMFSIVSDVGRRQPIQEMEDVTGLEFDVHAAVGPSDGRVVKILDEYNKTNLKPKEIGIWLSHHAAWESVLLNNYEAGMAIEDDVDMEVDIRTIWKEIMKFSFGKWDLMYTGWCFDDSIDQATRPEKLVMEIDVPGYGDWKWRLYTPTFAACTHAYAFNHHAAEYLNETSIFYKPADRQSPIDMHLANSVVKTHLRTVMLHPPLFKQRGGLPQGDPLRHSAEHELELRDKVKQMRANDKSADEISKFLDNDKALEDARRKKDDAEAKDRLTKLWEEWDIIKDMTPEEREERRKAKEEANV